MPTAMEPTASHAERGVDATESASMRRASAPAVQGCVQNRCMRCDPVLASSVGRYGESLPSTSLRMHFECVWASTLPLDHHRPIAVVPDGHVDLLWRNGCLSVVGPDVVAATPTVPPGTTVLGMRFQPGAANRWLGLPMSEIVGCEIGLTDLWGRGASDLARQMGDAQSLQTQAQVMQAWLSQRMRSIALPAPEAAAIFRAMGAAPDRDDRRIRGLQDRLGMSERTLRRRSHDHFGYGPKTLGRILRFQRFMSIARASPHAGLSALAADAGYADQAHLGREVQSLCGMTALALLRQLRTS